MTEHTTIDNIFSFIDTLHIKTVDALELKSRIDDTVQGERAKAIDELERRLIINFSNWQMSLAEIGNEKEYDTIEKAIKGIEEIAEQMKGGVK